MKLMFPVPREKPSEDKISSSGGSTFPSTNPLSGAGAPFIRSSFSSRARDDEVKEEEEDKESVRLKLISKERKDPSRRR